MNARRAGGFSLIELVVVVVAVGVLCGVALDRLLPLIGRAQRAAFVQVRSELQSALLLEAADRITRGEAVTLGELAAANPMTLLLQAPENYLGELDPSAAHSAPGHTWYFDAAQRRLVYRVGRYTRFEPRDAAADRIALAVHLAYADVDGNGAFDPVRDRFHGLRLDTLTAYRWPD